MAMQIKNLDKKKSQDSLTVLSQKELAKRINKSTRQSYKYLEALIWKGVGDGR